MEIDQIFVGIHVRLTRLSAEYVPPFVRTWLCWQVFITSGFLFISLICLHHVHMHPGIDPANKSPTCFPHISSLSAGTAIIHVKILPPHQNYSLLYFSHIMSWFDEYKPHQPIDSQTKDDTNSINTSTRVQVVIDDLGNVMDETVFTPLVDPIDSNSPPISLSSQPSYHQQYLTRIKTFDYTAHKGLFLLPLSSHSHLNIRTFTFTLSSIHPCMGHPILAFLTFHLFGYDSIVIEGMKREMGGTGYVRNGWSRDIYSIGDDISPTTNVGELDVLQDNSSSPLISPSISSIDNISLGRKISGYLYSLPAPFPYLFHLLYLFLFKLELLITTLFLFFATTTLVSSTLTQTQIRMLTFTESIRHSIRLRHSIVGLVLEHTMQSLSFVPVVVGILFFLFEFFHDQILAFMLLMLVWICESYCVLFTRTTTSMLYFPSLFAISFLTFGVYFFSFPHGFHYLAMGLTASNLLYVMLYYWWQYEVPAVLNGEVSIHRPRMLVLRRESSVRAEEDRRAVLHQRELDHLQLEVEHHQREAEHINTQRTRIADVRPISPHSSMDQMEFSRHQSTRRAHSHSATLSPTRPSNAAPTTPSSIRVSESSSSSVSNISPTQSIPLTSTSPPTLTLLSDYLHSSSAFSTTSSVSLSSIVTPAAESNPVSSLSIKNLPILFQSMLKEISILKLKEEKKKEKKLNRSIILNKTNNDKKYQNDLTRRQRSGSALTPHPHDVNIPPADLHEGRRRSYSTHTHTELKEETNNNDGNSHSLSSKEVGSSNGMINCTPILNDNDYNLFNQNMGITNINNTCLNSLTMNSSVAEIRSHLLDQLTQSIHISLYILNILLITSNTPPTPTITTPTSISTRTLTNASPTRLNFNSINEENLNNQNRNTDQKTGVNNGSNSTDNSITNANDLVNDSLVSNASHKTDVIDGYDAPMM